MIISRAYKLDKKLASDPCGLVRSTGRAADQYLEDASSNPARVNIFELTSAVSDYHEKFLFIVYYLIWVINDKFEFQRSVYC